METSNPRAPIFLIITASLFILMQAWAFAMKTPYGEPPDEIAHLSYVADAKQDWVPNLIDGRINQTKRLNYMAHPPAYYSALGAISRIFQLDPYEDYQTLRAITSVIFGAGFFAFLLVLRNLGASSSGIVASTAVCSVIPMFTYLGGSVNNDVLAYSFTACFLLGFSRYQFKPEKLNSITATLIVLGLVGAVFSKATTAVFILFFGIATAILYLESLGKAFADRRFQISIALIASTVAMYFIPTLFVFGTLFPKPSELYPRKALDAPLSLVEYSFKFSESMWERLPFILSQKTQSPYESNTKQIFYFVFLVPLIALLASFVLKKFNDDNKRFLYATLLGATGFAAVHFYTAYTAYLGHGVMAGIQPRYYFFLLPILLGAYSCTRSPRLRESISALLIIFSIILFWCSGIPDIY